MAPPWVVEGIAQSGTYPGERLRGNRRVVLRHDKPPEPKIERTSRFVRKWGK